MFFSEPPGIYSKHTRLPTSSLRLAMDNMCFADFYASAADAATDALCFCLVRAGFCPIPSAFREQLQLCL